MATARSARLFQTLLSLAAVGEGWVRGVEDCTTPAGACSITGSLFTVESPRTCLQGAGEEGVRSEEESLSPAHPPQALGPEESFPPGPLCLQAIPN